MKKHTQNNEKSIYKQAPIAILGAIILGAIGSGVWELIAKPGLTVLNRTVLTIITFGSETLYNAAYESAALNPTSLPSLLLVVSVINIPLLYATYVFYVEFIRPRIKRKFEDKYHEISNCSESLTDEQEKTLENEYIKAKKKKRRLAIFLIIYCFCIFLLLNIGSRILNQSILIWRVFNANIEIISPYISNDEIKQLRSQFSQVTSKDDFSKLESRILKIANTNNATLRKEKLW